jgi:uncharacterized membrane protein
MVQLLLLLNLFAAILLALLLLNLFLSLKELRRKEEELEKDLLKALAAVEELKARVEQTEAKLLFVQREFKSLKEG